MEILGIIVVIAIIGGIIGLVYYLDKKRTEAFRAYAEKHNYTFQENGWSALSPYNFDLFSKGQNRSSKRLIQGEYNDLKFILCDYKYDVVHYSNGKRQTSTYKQTIIVVNTDFDFPYFTLRPENFFDKVAGVVGFKDINFDSHPKFSKMFCLKGENEKMIRNAFTSDVLSYYEDNKGVITEAEKKSLIFYKKDTTISSDEKDIDDFIRKGTTVAKLFKEGRI